MKLIKYFYLIDVILRSLATIFFFEVQLKLSSRKLIL